MFNSKDLRLEVGIKAYEKYTGKKLNRDEIQLYCESEEYRHGVFILHIPTGETAYSNSENGQLKNKEKALRKLKNKLEGINI